MYIFFFKQVKKLLNIKNHYKKYLLVECKKKLIKNYFLYIEYSVIDLNLLFLLIKNYIDIILPKLKFVYTILLHIYLDVQLLAS